MIQRKCHRLAAQRKSTQVDRKPSGDARNLRLFATCVNFRTFTSPYTSSAFATLFFLRQRASPFGQGF